MKKMLGVMMVAMVWMAIAIPASAIENEFGGYWRTRGVSMQDFNNGLYNLEGSNSYVDTRTRLFYTAKFNDKFKFVNKFEFNTTWGDIEGGDIGADGGTFKIKNSYADFSIGDTNFKVGVQPGKIARGFLFDDDFAGLIATVKFGSVSLPFIWMKVEDNDCVNAKTFADSKVFPAKTDRDYLALSPVFNINETLSVNPYLLIDKQQKMEEYNYGREATDAKMFTDTDAYYFGVDVNAKIDALTAWGTFIYETGDMDYLDGDHVKQSADINAFLVAAGADAGLVHGQAFYATGNKDDDDDVQAFGLLQLANNRGQTYYWSEIMGEGIFDGTRSHNAPGTKISNIMAANVGVTVKPMDKLTLTGDIWYAQLAEEVANEDVLGTEIDLKATYMLLDNLKLDVVAAYLFAGDATGEEDPIEIGTQLSFSF